MKELPEPVHCDNEVRRHEELPVLVTLRRPSSPTRRAVPLVCGDVDGVSPRSRRGTLLSLARDEPPVLGV